MADYILNDMGICPFCKRRIHITYNTVLNLTYRTDLHDKTTLENLNTGTCMFCDEFFRYETEVFAFDFDNKYAIIVNKQGNETYYSHLRKDIYNLAFDGDFKLRYVYTYLEMLEKVLLFSCVLDDKVIEIAKQMYFADIMDNLKEHHRFLVTDIDKDEITFTLYDDHDKVVTTKSLDISKIANISANVEDIVSEFAVFKKIDNNWANKYLNGGNKDE